MPLRSVKALTVVAVGAFLFLLLLALFWPRRELLVLSGSTMGTQWQVQVVDDGEGQLNGLADAIATLLQELDRQVFSTWTPDSELSRLNQAAPDTPVGVSSDLLTVLQEAQRIHAASDGAFDPSIGPLVDLWGFGPVTITASPDPAAIEAARARLATPQLHIDVATGTVRRPDGMQLDLSGIAKGYAVDRVAALLDAAGFSSYLVEIGGELRLRGLRADDTPWTIAIEQPDPTQRVPHALIDSRGEALALAGSGDYRNYRIVNGVRQSHEIDPLLGIPVQHALAAVTVLADTAMEADAWATALMVLGPADGMRVADRLGLSAYFIIREDNGWTSRYSGRFEAFLTQAAEPHP